MLTDVTYKQTVSVIALLKDHWEDNERSFHGKKGHINESNFLASRSNKGWDM